MIIINTVAIYARVSTDEQNIDQQREQLINYSKQRGWKYRSYLDFAVSGKAKEKPAWQQLVKAVEEGKHTIIIVQKFDRLTRVLSQAIELYSWLTNTNTQLISLYDNVDLKTPEGYFSFMLKCLLSEYELIQLDQRRRIGIERAKKEGKYKGGKKGRKWKK